MGSPLAHGTLPLSSNETHNLHDNHIYRMSTSADITREAVSIRCGQKSYLSVYDKLSSFLCSTASVITENGVDRDIFEIIHQTIVYSCDILILLSKFDTCFFSSR